MAAKKTQEEAELLVKNYQLDAVESQVQALQEQMKEGFKQANEGIRTLIQKSDGQVTPQQLTDNVSALKSGFDQQIKESEEKQTLRINRLEENVKGNNKNMNRFTWIVIGTGVSIIGAAFVIVLKGGNV